MSDLSQKFDLNLRIIVIQVHNAGTVALYQLPQISALVLWINILQVRDGFFILYIVLRTTYLSICLPEW